MKTKLKILSTIFITLAVLLTIGATETYAAISSAGTLGATSSKSNNQTSIVHTVTNTAEAGNLVIFSVARDNTTALDTSDEASHVSSVTDSQSNTYTLAHDYTNDINGAQSGAWVGVYYSVLDTQLTGSTDTITVNFANSADVDASAISAWEYTIGAGNTISVNSTTERTDDNADAGSNTISSLANQEWLFYKGIAAETDNTGGTTNTTNYTTITDATTTGNPEHGNMAVAGEFRIVTATSGTSDPTLSDTSNDNVSVFIAFEEVATVDFSGTIYDSDESTQYLCNTTGNLTVNLRVDGSGSYTDTCTVDTGTSWEITGVTASAGQTITIYTDTGSVRTAHYLVSDGTNQTNVDLYTDRVILRDDNDNSITTSEIDSGDTADADDLVTGSYTTSSSYETHIWGGDTFAPGTNVTTGKLHIPTSSTYSGGTETLELQGTGTGTSRPLYVDGGTFTTPDQTTFSGDGDTDIEGTTYDALSFTPTITAGRAYTFTGAATINGNFNVNPDAASSLALTVNAGGNISVGSAYTTTLTGTTSGTSTLDLRPNTTDYDLSTGTLNVASAGTLDAASAASTITLAGTSGTLFTRAGTFNQGNSTVTATSASGTPTLNSGTITFYNLTINPSSLTISTATDNITVSNTLNVSTGDTLSLVSGQTLDHTGSTLTLDGTISGAGKLLYKSSNNFPTGGTFSADLRIDGTNGNRNVVDRTNGYGGALEIYSNSSTDRTFTIGTGAVQSLDVTGNLTLNANNTGAVTLSGATHNPTVNVTGNLDSTSGGGTENLTTGTGTWTVTGNVDFTDVGTFTATSTNTFIMDGSSTTVTSAGETFQNFQAAGTISNVDTMDVDGTFTVTAGNQFTHGAGAGIDISVAGDFTIADTADWVENTTATSDLIFDGDLNYADNNTDTKESVGNVVIGVSPETTNLTTDFAANSLTVNSGDFFNTCEYEVDIGNSDITINGTMDTSASGNASSVSPCNAGNEGDETTINLASTFLVAVGGTFVQDNSTLITDNTAGTDTITLNGESLWNLTVSPAGTTQFSDTIDIDNDVSITSGELDMNGQNVTIGGNFDDDATFTHNNAPIIFDAQSGTKTIGGDFPDNFYSVEFDDGGGGATWQLVNNAMTTDDNFTITSGEVDLNAYDLNIGGNYHNSGTFTPNGQIVAMRAQDAGHTLSGTMTGASSFYTLSFNDNGNSGTWTFGANPVTVIGDFSIPGGSVTAPSTTLTIGGNFTNSDGFNHNSGTVEFNDSGRTSTLTYSATTTFNNFTVSTAGKQMIFEDTDSVVTDIDGLLTLQGTNCTSGRVFLDGNGGLEWEIDVSGGSTDIDYVDVQDSTANNATITAESSTEDNGGNTNWTVNNGTCGPKQPNIRGNVNVRGGTRIK